ncbi:hypothetical protein [Aeromonas salmonicida]|uniref:hypothetical protein n=1 Tax=Aeromonas salmonicida TaxID=645 RepID=UPI001F28CBEE|nr:hypothetical protein [Aeromonas salmonicida]MCE9933879.1 hypothetical protein [Aeromonas salmonicida]
MKSTLTGLFLLSGLSISHAFAFTPNRHPSLPAEDIVFVETLDRPSAYIFGIANKNISLNGATMINRSGPTLARLMTMNNFLPSEIKLGYKLDIWMDSPISYPFPNIYCYGDYAEYASSCNRTYHETNAKPAHLDSKGFYGFSDRRNKTNSSVNLKLGQGYFNYLKNVPIGTTISQELNYCLYQDKNNSGRCLSQPSDSVVDWHSVNFSTKKSGHLTFMSYQIDTEIIIDSNGNAVPAPGSTRCIKDRVFYTDGVVCDITDYDIAWSGSVSPFKDLYFYGQLRSSVIYGEFFALKFGSGQWHGLDQVGSVMRENISTRRGKEKAQLFISSRLLTSLTNGGRLKMSDIVDIYVGGWNGMVSGYLVPFTGDITVTPRAQTVAIKSADGMAKPFQEGEVGKDDLQFKYALSETGYTSASRLEVSVRQDRGSPYKGLCTFYPEGQTSEELAVPVPTALSFKAADNRPKVLPIRCDGTPIELRTQALMDSKPVESWYEAGWIYKRSYEVGLNFLLTDEVVKKTVTGSNWEGATHQSGTITLKGIWN